jgi:hypothetical protein
MIHLFASFDPKAELWVGDVKSTHKILPIHAEAATLDDLLAKVWAMIRDLTDDGLEVPQLTVVVDMKDARGLLETLHLQRSSANAKRLDEVITEVEASKVTERQMRVARAVMKKRRSALRELANK